MKDTKKSKNKDLFVLKQVNLAGLRSLLVGIEYSGVIKITYDETTVKISVWNSACTEILHEISFSHEQLTQNNS